MWWTHSSRMGSLPPSSKDSPCVQLQQTEAAHEKELEAAAERLALATDRHGLERRRLQAQLDKLMEAHRSPRPPVERWQRRRLHTVKGRGRQMHSAQMKSDIDRGGGTLEVSGR